MLQLTLFLHVLAFVTPVKTSDFQDYVIAFSTSYPQAALSLPGGGRFLDTNSGNRAKTPSFTFRSASLSVEAAAQLRQQQGVKSVEVIKEAKIDGIVTQTGINYNQPRIIHRQRGFTSHEYDSSAGNGTCIFVLDTGFAAHTDFNGRYFAGPAFFPRDRYPGINIDEDGHGTHVAGIAGSTTYGVAKKARIISVKVCGISVMKLCHKR